MALAWALAACGHSDPFGAPPTPADGPLIPGSPARLTYSPFNDLGPRFAADGGIYYTFTRGPQDGGDHCLGLLPPKGGTRSETCLYELATQSTIETFSSAATTADGDLAYVFGQALRGSPVLVRSEIRATRVGTSLDFRTVQSFPITVGGAQVDAASHVEWVDPETIVYLAERLQYLDDVAIPTGVAVATVRRSGGGSHPVPGTLGAASAALDAAKSGLYFTRSSDARVYHVPLAGGTPTEIYNFGVPAPTIAIAVAGRQLVAAVNGALYRLDLETASATLVPGSAVLGSAFTRPTLAPDGAIVAEGRVPAASPGTDLYRFESP